MKIQDILRQLIDTLDEVEQTRENPSNQDDTLTRVTVDNTDNTEADVMIPPLQAKLELLKRATDVPNVYDEIAPEDTQCGSDDYSDEVDGIKRLAGVPVTAIFAAGEDSPLN